MAKNDLWVTAKSGKTNIENWDHKKEIFLDKWGNWKQKHVCPMYDFGAAAPGGHQGLRKEGALPGSKRTWVFCFFVRIISIYR